jgi:hypothetical protein
MRVRRNSVVAIGIVGALGISGALALGAPVAGAASAPAPTSADFNLTFSVSTVGGTTVTGSGNGQVNFSTDELEATVNLPGGLAPILTLLPSSLAGATSGIKDDTQVQAVVSGGTVYVTLPGLTLTKSDTVGIGFTAATVAKIFTAVDGGLGNASSLLEKITGKHVHVKSLGKGTVDGVPAKGYSATVVTSHMLSLIPGIGSAIGITAAKDIGTSIPVDVWTNAAGQIIQISINGTRANAKVGVKSIKASVNFSGYGSAVTVVTPANAKVIPWSTIQSLVKPAATAHATAKGKGKK